MKGIIFAGGSGTKRYTIEQFGKRETSIVKGVAVCFMLIHHLFYDESKIEKCTLLFTHGGLLLWVAKMCKVCVAIFVLLSAYGLYKSYESYCSKKGYCIKNAILFTFKHLKKLITNYWWAVVPFAILGMTTGMRSFKTVYGASSMTKFRLLADIFGLGGRVDSSHMYNITCWYIALAIGLYLLFSILYYLIKKNTVLFCGVALILCFRPFGAVLFTAGYRIYLLSFSLGLFIAKYDLFDKLICNIHNLPTQFGIVLSLIGTALLRKIYGLDVDGFFAISVIAFILLVISKLSVVASVFDFIGKHSADIFMTHTFFYSYFWNKLFYSPKYPALIFLFLLSVCLVYSIFLETIKSFVRSIINKIRKKAILQSILQ